MKKIILCFLLINFNYTIVTYANEIKILYKVNQNIITNHDIDEEINYLTSLNKNLNQLNTKELAANAERSLIREIIKKDEIDKVYEINYVKTIESDNFKRIIENFRESLGFTTDNEFEDYLKNNDIDLNELKNKFIIEQFWNQLIVDKYQNVIKIDSKKINDELEKLIKNKSEISSFHLSEIIFLEKDKTSIEKKYQDIISSIETVGFSDAAVLHSISESSKLGGDIGWINENQVSKKVFSAIKNLKINEVSKPIITSGGIILLMIKEKKNVSIEVNKDEELKRLILFEKNRLFNEYSIIYYKELENKAYVKKY